MSEKHTFNSAGLASFNPEDWGYLGLWKEPIFAAWFWQDWYRKEMAEAIGLDMHECSMFGLSYGHVFYNLPGRERMRGFISNLVEQKDSFFDTFEERTKAAYEAGLTFAAEELEHLEPTRENFDRLVSIVRTIMFYWGTAASQIAYVLEELFLEQVAKEGISAEAVAGLIVIDTPLYRQPTELRALKREIGNRTLDEVRADATLAAKFEDHRKRYGWIEMMNWIGDELTSERLFDLIQEVSLDGTVHESPQLSEDLSFLVRSLTAIGYGKQGSAEHVSMLHLSARPFLTRIAERFDLSYRELMNLTHDEIREGLSGVLSVDEIKNRLAGRTENKWLVLADEEGTATYIDDPEDIRYLETFIPRAAPDMKELKGQIANRGNARGQ